MVTILRLYVIQPRHHEKELFMEIVLLHAIGAFDLLLISGLSYLLLATLFVIIPVHVFNLLYFEEGELRLRYGASYEKYKARAPFIIPRRFRERSC